MLFIDDDARWGPGQGGRYTRAQIQENFLETKSRLEVLEASISAANPITSITISGTDLVFTFEDATTSTLPFPVLGWNWRGDWLASTLYASLDTFIVDGVGLYIVLVDHVSALAFDEAAVDVGSNPEYQKLFGFSGLSGAAIVDLTDVAITSAADKDFFVYNTAAVRWKNVTKTVATGYLDAVVGDSGSGGTKGLAPAPASGDAAAGKFLKANGTWAVPPGGTGSVSLAGQTDVDISAPTNDDVLQYKTSDGKWHNTALADIGGTVTTVIAGSGISTGGSDITTTGTVSLESVSDNRILANVTGASNPPAPVTLSALLDHIAGNSRGSIIRRDATGWSVLDPGTSGQYLKSGGAGVDVTWDSPAGSGTVTSVATGTGLTGGPVTGTGSISLDAIATSRVMANISGISAVPSATTVSNLIDNAIGSTRGAILYRGASGWTKLDPGTSGRVLQSSGAGADPIWAVSSSSSLAGETDVTVSSAADKDFFTYDLGAGKWANTSNTVSTSYLVVMVGDSGSGGTKGLVPAPGSGDAAAGRYLKADGTWGVPPGTATGTVTSVATGTGLTGGAITGSGTISLGTVADGRILANISGSTAAPTANTLSGIVDSVIGSTRGAVLYRGASGWAKLDPSAAGRVLYTNGVGADPSWGDVAAFLSDLTDVNVSSPANLTLLRFQTSDSKWHAVSLNNELNDVFSSTQGKMLRRGASVWQAEDDPLPVPTFMSGAPAASAVIRYIVTDAMTFPINFSDSKGNAKTAPTADADIDVSINGVSVGTVHFAAASNSATFSSVIASPTVAAVGTVIEFAFPASPDATMANIAITLRGVRN